MSSTVSLGRSVAFEELSARYVLTNARQAANAVQTASCLLLGRGISDGNVLHYNADRNG